MQLAPFHEKRNDLVSTRTNSADPNAIEENTVYIATVVPTKSDSDFMFCLLSHARETLYTKDAVIVWWLQSTSAQNSVHLYQAV